MTVEQAVCDRLATAAGVIALVGTRVYQLRLPQMATLPAVRVQFVSVVDFYHLRGGDVMELSRVQTDAYAVESSGSDPYASVAAVADAVHDALNGAVFETTGLKVTAVFRESRQPLYEADELREVRMMQDYRIWSRRTA